HSYLATLQSLVDDPQHAVPDIFLWLVSGGKRQAYHRIIARDILYAIVDEERGKSCGKVQTIFLKLPGKKAVGPTGWAIQAKLQISLWLGLLKQKKNFLNGVPNGYEITQEIRNADRPHALPPLTIHYTEKHVFQLRAHIYQARSLIGSDASGLSDPFATVIAGEFSKTTQVIDETVSPTWDELLIFDEILIYGTSEDIQQDPPFVIIEIFDQDKVGKSEFIGRTMAKPHVKLRGDAYWKPKFPPSLEWFDVKRSADRAGELLATFELLEYPDGDSKEEALPPTPETKQASDSKDTDMKDLGPILPVPKGIRPTLCTYRIEVLFWGLRDLKRVHLMTVDKPRVDIDCAGHTLYSPIIPNAKKNPNFSSPIKFLDLELPEQELYRPPLTIRAVDCRSFGRYTLVGTHTINSIQKYIYVPRTRREREAEERKRSINAANQTNETHATLNTSTDDENKEKSPLLPKEPNGAISYGSRETTKKPKPETQKKKSEEDELEHEEEDRDWWTKYYSSGDVVKDTRTPASKNQSLLRHDISPSDLEDVEVISSKSTDRKKFGFKAVGTATRFVTKLSPKATGKPKRKSAFSRIFDMELEKIPEFNGFKDWLHTFELYRGKKSADESEDDNRIVGSFKGAITIYKWPLPNDFEDFHLTGFDLNYGLLQGLPSNEQIRVLVRVYVVKALELHPMDLNGKADPYIVLQLGAKRVTDKENYVSKQLNPVFGKCFEFEATFPQDSLLTVQIFDWDLVSADDMIGETKIDLENRFYSRHRATCGIALKYEEDGYNAWRDPMKPTQILAKLCKEAKIDPPVYTPGHVKVGRITVPVNVDEVDDLKIMEERMALTILHKWQEFPIGCYLTPEHIETRSLYNPEKPGMEQGKIEMWVDMFPMDMPLPGPPTNISPRKPKGYELRVIIWNTDEVVLEDDAFFTGEKMSDIYVKGWVKGTEDNQSTDIHYRSLTGEGNFNWRFVYNFDYLSAERRIVITKKESVFSWDESETKIPARLDLQVWDADHFSADDFLGALTLDLNKFPRGAKSAKLCTMEMITRNDGSVPMVNIFKQKRIKGWWPFYIKKDNEVLELTGKVEAELHLLTQEEAEKNPVGLGRNEPEPLDKPNRPDTSFVWFMNPLKSLRYILWQNLKWKILKFLVILALTLLLLLFFYSLPGYTAKRIVGAK
ncbi:otoferlin-like, partial [Photinus pyralis]